MKDIGRRAAFAARLAAAIVAIVLPSPGVAQVFQGRVLDLENDAPVVTALVRLLDGEGRDVGFSLADSLGGYRIAAPGPGAYRLLAERIGYATSETPLLEVSNPDGVYLVDLTARRLASGIVAPQTGSSFNGSARMRSADAWVWRGRRMLPAGAGR